MVARCLHLPNLSAQLHGRERRWHRGHAGHYPEVRPRRSAWCRCNLDFSVFKSPMDDFGYDVSDYCDVDPCFGTLADFDALVARAHELGLKVIIDQVYSHSSSEHAWFEESRSSRDNPKADWYTWVDAKPEGHHQTTGSPFLLVPHGHGTRDANSTIFTTSSARSPILICTTRKYRMRCSTRHDSGWIAAWTDSAWMPSITACTMSR